MKTKISELYNDREYLREGGYQLSQLPFIRQELKTFIAELETINLDDKSEREEYQSELNMFVLIMMYYGGGVQQEDVGEDVFNQLMELRVQLHRRTDERNGYIEMLNQY